MRSFMHTTLGLVNQYETSNKRRMTLKAEGLK